MTDWENQVRTVHGQFQDVETKMMVQEIWRQNLNLGHRTLGRLLLADKAGLERLIEKREGE